MADLAETRLDAPQGACQLERYPRVRRPLLRAWDAADVRLLEHAHEAGLTGPVVILNDGWGALTTALADGRRVHTIADGWTTHEATRQNLQVNGRDPSTVQLLDGLSALDEPVRCLLFKVPSTTALLEDQLHRLRGQLADDCTIVGAGMVKQIHSSTLAVCERLIGPTATTRAQQRARLIHVEFNAALTPGDSPYPTTYALEEPPLTLTTHAGVFSREGLDVGTRLLVDHLPGGQAQCIVDAGCGNGVIGLIAGTRHQTARLVFTDVSARAVASTRENLAALMPQRETQVVWTDAVDGVADGCADLVLCNPPFHQQRTVDEGMARRLLAGAHRVLAPGGELRIVGNRHLDYHRVLRRIFGGSEVVAQDGKFVVLRALKPQ